MCCKKRDDDTEERPKCHLKIKTLSTITYFLRSVILKNNYIKQDIKLSE